MRMQHRCTFCLLAVQDGFWTHVFPSKLLSDRADICPHQWLLSYGVLTNEYLRLYISHCIHKWLDISIICTLLLTDYVSLSSLNTVYRFKTRGITEGCILVINSRIIDSIWIKAYYAEIMCTFFRVYFACSAWNFLRVHIHGIPKQQR